MVRRLNREFLTTGQWDKVIAVRQQQHIAMIKDLVDEILEDINDHGIVANNALMYEIAIEFKEEGVSC